MVRLLTRRPSLSNSPRIRSAQKTPILHCHFLNQRHGLRGYLWFGSSCSGFVLPIQLKSLAMPAQKGLGLDNEQGLLPCARRSSEKDQDHPIRLRECWSFACRRRIMSCCRRKAFSATSSDLLLL